LFFLCRLLIPPITIRLRLWRHTKHINVHVCIYDRAPPNNEAAPWIIKPSLSPLNSKKKKWKKETTKEWEHKRHA
jgi:hypothetical protein